MVSSAKLLNQLEQLNIDCHALGEGFVHALANALSASEEVVGACAGWIQFGEACLVITNSRVILMRKGFFGGLTQSSIALDNVTAVECESGRRSGKIGVWSTMAYGEIRGVRPEECQPVANSLDLAARAYRNEQVSVQTPEQRRQNIKLAA